MKKYIIRTHSKGDFYVTAPDIESAISFTLESEGLPETDLKSIHVRGSDIFEVHACKVRSGTLDAFLRLLHG